MRDILADLERFRPHLVHCATEFAMGLAGIKAARRLRLPAVASAHTDYQKYAARYGVEWAIAPGWVYLRWFYRQMERVLCPSRIYERHLRSHGIANTGIWSRGVEQSRFNPAFRSEAWRRRFGAGPDDLLVTYVGRIAREKDLDLLLAAWELLSPRRGNAQLVLVGSGPMTETIRRRAIPGVHVTGLVHGRELSEAYASADLFVFPSATETFGNSLLEAMASGLPSLAVDAGGVVEFAQQGRNAWLVEPRSVAALWQGFERLLCDGELRRRLREGAVRTAAERRWDVIDDRLIEEYRAALEKGRSRVAA
jgi:glycosyltransferase involved in cell wall biosynthesis